MLCSRHSHIASPHHNDGAGRTRANSRHALPAEYQRGLYEAIFRRRDIRNFIADEVPDEVLARVIVAAHHAASVGFTQPWDFIVVRDTARRREVKRVFEDEREANAARFTGERLRQFLSLKLEGILEAPLNLIITCEPDRFGPAVLGKVSIREVEVYSTCLAVGNLWLAARAEGLGVGWVSIVRNDALREIFSIPPHVIPVAYLCVGYVAAFPDRPVLESTHWASRMPPRTLLHFDSWDGRTEGDGHSLSDLVQSPEIWRDLLADAPPLGDDRKIECADVPNRVAKPRSE
ncbi:MAG TPA: 5,6-dimethylbenzimidazole synthase [Candidatus Binataceae bacterium]